MEEAPTKENLFDTFISNLVGLVENTEYTASQVVEELEEALEEELREEEIKRQEEQHRTLGEEYHTKLSNRTETEEQEDGEGV